MTFETPRASEVQWLLDGDPAIRWQTQRDLVGAARSTVDRERRKADVLWRAKRDLLPRRDSPIAAGAAIRTPAE